MYKSFLNTLSCPRCLGNLKLNEIQNEMDNVTKGSLHCINCHFNFDIEEGVSIFGLKLDHKEERIKEIKAENEWTSTANDLQSHINFAMSSSKKGKQIIDYIEAFDENSMNRRKVLDIGSGWGCFQAWQFASRGYDVTATEICPEFIFASDKVVKECYFERVITDCTVLPFKDQSFDIVFCKETLHHINDPKSLLDEIWRVCSPNGLIIIKEPCVSSLLKLFITKVNRAARIGITHHFRTSNEYMKTINDITSNPVINRESFTKDFRFIRYIPFSDFINNLSIIILGSDFEVFGIKRTDYKSEVQVNREIIPININELNLAQIKYYRDDLIPEVLKLFY